MVKISNHTISVYKNSDYSDVSIEDNLWDVLIMTIKTYDKVFIGDKPAYYNAFSFSEDLFSGNSILVKITKHKYIHIGVEIYEFTTEDEIMKYFSPVGNSDVPYPYAVGRENTYLMIEYVFIKNSLIKDMNPYHYYYDNILGRLEKLGRPVKRSKKQKQELKQKLTKPMKITVLHPAIW